MAFVQSPSNLSGNPSGNLCGPATPTVIPAAAAVAWRETLPETPPLQCHVGHHILLVPPRLFPPPPPLPPPPPMRNNVHSRQIDLQHTTTHQSSDQRTRFSGSSACEWATKLHLEQCRNSNSRCSNSRCSNSRCSNSRCSNSSCSNSNNDSQQRLRSMVPRLVSLQVLRPWIMGIPNSQCHQQHRRRTLPPLPPPQHRSPRLPPPPLAITIFFWRTTATTTMTTMTMSMV